MSYNQNNVGYAQQQNGYQQPTPQQGYQQGGYSASQQGNQQPVPQQGGYPPAQQNGYAPAPQQSNYQQPAPQQGYAPAPQQGGYQQPAQQRGGYASVPQQGYQQSAAQQGGYAPAQQQGGYQQSSVPQGQEQKFYTFCEFVPAVNEAKNTTYIHATVEAAVTNCSGLKSLPDGTPCVNFSIPIQNRLKTLERAFGNGMLTENNNGTVWANGAMYGDTATRFMKMLNNPKHSNPVLLVTGNANVKDYTKKDGTPGTSLNINVNNFMVLRDRKGSCMDSKVGATAQSSGYQSSFGGYNGGSAPASSQQYPLQMQQGNPSGFYDLSDVNDGDLPF